MKQHKVFRLSNSTWVVQTLKLRTHSASFSKIQLFSSDKSCTLSHKGKKVILETGILWHSVHYFFVCSSLKLKKLQNKVIFITFKSEKSPIARSCAPVNFVGPMHDHYSDTLKLEFD